MYWYDVVPIVYFFFCFPWGEISDKILIKAIFKNQHTQIKKCDTPLKQNERLKTL